MDMPQDDERDTSTSKLKDALETRDVASPRSVSMEDGSDWNIIDFAMTPSHSNLSLLKDSVQQSIQQQLQAADLGVEEKGTSSEGEQLADQVLRRPLQNAAEQEGEEGAEGRASGSAQPGLEGAGGDQVAAPAVPPTGLATLPSNLAQDGQVAEAITTAGAVASGQLDTAAPDSSSSETALTAAPTAQVALPAEGPEDPDASWSVLSSMCREATRLRAALDKVVRYMCQHCATGARSSFACVASLCRDFGHHTAANAHALASIVVNELRKVADWGAAWLSYLAAPLARPLHHLAAPLQQLTAPLGQLVAPLGHHARWVVPLSLTAVAAMAVVTSRQSHIIRALRAQLDERNKELAGVAMRVLRLQDMLTSPRHAPPLYHVLM